jgi:hypothetical protein
MKNLGKSLNFALYGTSDEPIPIVLYQSRKDPKPRFYEILLCENFDAARK